jgi:mitochondrial fission protein ELM1
MHVPYVGFRAELIAHDRCRNIAQIVPDVALRRNVEAIRPRENCATKRKHSPSAMVNGTRTVLNLTVPDSHTADSLAAEDMAEDPVDLQGMLQPLSLGSRPAAEIWVLLTHAVGDNEQCLALAEALGRPYRGIRLDWSAAGRALDRFNLNELLRDGLRGRVQRDSIGLRAPWPRLVICSGRRADAVAFWIKRRSGGRSKIVTLGRAHAALAAYDLIVASPQYLQPDRANVIHLTVPISRVRPEIGLRAPAAQTMGPKPWFTLLLGGRVNQFAACEAALKQAALFAQLAAERSGGSVIVSTSRRTPAWLLAAVESELETPTVYHWTRDAPDNPYATLLQGSAAIFVTGDSASMMLDACCSGTPTYLIEMPERLDARQLFRRGLYGLISGAAGSLRMADLCSFARVLDHAQDWLHARRILRYPRDLRRLHSRIVAMGLARSASEFDPSQLPARRDTDHQRGAPELQAVLDRCATWLPPREGKTGAVVADEDTALPTSEA